MSQVEVAASCYCFNLPLAFYPDYSKHGLKKNDSLNQYDFKYEAVINSKVPISHVSVPTNAIVAQKNDDRTQIKIESTKPARNVSLYYRTADMMVP